MGVFSPLLMTGTEVKELRLGIPETTVGGKSVDR